MSVSTAAIAKSHTELKTTPAKPRVEYLDAARGLAILSVIICHGIYFYPINVNWVFTFHVPLFFIISGFFFKAGRETNYKKLIKSLIIPYFILTFCGTILFPYLLHYRAVHLKSQLIAILYGNGERSYLHKCLIDNVTSINMRWFLLAMFWCKAIYNELNKLAEKYKFSMFWATVILAAASMELNRKICLPFSLLPGITAMLFYHFGRIIKEKNIFELKLKDIPPLVTILALVLWECSCKYGQLRLHANTIKLTLDIISAFIGVFFVVKLSMLLIKIPVLSGFLKWCGKNSMVIYGVHSLDAVIKLALSKVFPRFNKINSFAEFAVFTLILICCILFIAFIYRAAVNLAKKLFSGKKGNAVAAYSKPIK